MDFTTTKRNLEKHGFTVTVFPNREEAVRHLEETIQRETVGFGGSVTLEEIGLYDRLCKNNNVFWHWKEPKARNYYSDFTTYVTSVNGLSETGELVNIDGAGNRVAASIYGPKKVFFIAGRNKLSPDLASAIERARQTASPLNNQRLGKKNPCVKDLKCHDCDSPERICCVMSVHMRPLHGVEHTEVVLIDEDLGY